jgi:ribonuclease HI
MKLVMHIDGASRGNPGEASVGAVVSDRQGKVLSEAGRSIGRGTNNQAEYMALLFGLDLVERIVGGKPGSVELLVRSDSQLLCRQLTGEYRIRNKELIKLSLEVRKRVKNYATFEIECIPREENRHADKLANSPFQRRRRLGQDFSLDEKLKS